MSRLRESTADKNPARRHTYDFPGLYDLQTALLYVRSQKLQTGQTFHLAVYPGTSPYLATVTVLGREKIKVKAGTYPAIKLDLKLQKITSAHDAGAAPEIQTRHRLAFAMTRTASRCA